MRKSKKSPEAKSWRDWLPVHPAADEFPLLPPAELKALAEDIRAHGLRNPWCLIEDEQGGVVLIDGRNRLDALELIGEEITLDNSIIFERFPADSVDVAERVVSLNIHRRHLSNEQKRELIAKLLKADPQKSDRQIAEQTKTSPTTVGKVRAAKEAAGDVSTVDTRTDSKGRRQPAKKKKKKQPAKPSVTLTSPPAKPKPQREPLTGGDLYRAEEEFNKKYPHIAEQNEAALRKEDERRIRRLVDAALLDIRRNIDALPVEQQRELLAELKTLVADIEDGMPPGGVTH
jgi:ParB-like chromosome segregation protein Spo0J